LKLETAVLATVLLSATTAGAQVTGVSGIAFVDTNGNGIPDQGEVGLAGVAVSDVVESRTP
jgi:hypothetical protein